MVEVVGLSAGHRRGEAAGVEQIASDQLHAAPKMLGNTERNARGTAYHGDDLVTATEQQLGHKRPVLAS